MIVSAIAAVSENYVIGKDNDLPWHLPDDFKWFKSVTKGHHVIMGRKNYESMGKPLPGRTNIVITRKKDYIAPGCVVVNSIEKAIDTARKNGEKEAFIIGGGEIYRQAMPYTDKLYITWVHAKVDGNVFFPEIDFDRWKEIKCKRHESDEKHQYSFSICVYI